MMCASFFVYLSLFDFIFQIEVKQQCSQSFVDDNAWYYPGRNMAQGGVQSCRSNWFSLDCREAEAMPVSGFVSNTWWGKVGVHMTGVSLRLPPLLRGANLFARCDAGRGSQ
jgi:hypothetical protein